MLNYLMSNARFQAKLSRHLDASLNGLSLHELLIMNYLDKSSEKLRAAQLADLMGLTPSGITRLLLPMIKIGLIRRQADPNDARSSLIEISRAGREKLNEGRERLEYFVEDNFPIAQQKKLAALTPTLQELAQRL
ncbi:MAG: MarR family transcriptional regulator [Patescibacteria group bacterium]|jgi:DNA-binding MarR family transcriptional regulator